MYHRLAIHQGHLDCFQVLAITNRAVKKICGQVFMLTCFQFLWVNIKMHD